MSCNWFTSEFTSKAGAFCLEDGLLRLCASGVDDVLMFFVFDMVGIKRKLL